MSGFAGPQRGTDGQCALGGGQGGPLTGAGTILGTFQDMAPEQLEGQEADARTDIFAFGAVVYVVVQSFTEELKRLVPAKE